MKGTLVFLVLVAMNFCAKFEDPRKREDVQTLNAMLTQRDRERNKLHHHVTYLALIEQERL